MGPAHFRSAGIMNQLTQAELGALVPAGGVHLAEWPAGRDKGVFNLCTSGQTLGAAHLPWPLRRATFDRFWAARAKVARGLRCGSAACRSAQQRTLAHWLCRLCAARHSGSQVERLRETRLSGLSFRGALLLSNSLAAPDLSTATAKLELTLTLKLELRASL